MPINPEELRLYLEAMNREKEERSREFPSDKVAGLIDTLRKNYRTFLDGAEKEIQVGQMVVWKDGMKNRKRPQYKEPAIVIQVAEEAGDAHIDPSNDSGSPYYREPLTIQLGLLDDDGEMTLYYFDKRRFRPFAQ
jgi:hypothetical protein